MKHSPILGIDLGTTYSAVAYINPAYNKAEIIPNAEGRNITPSVVQIQPDRVVVGETAKQEVAIEKENTAQFFKRDMGTGAIYNYQGHNYTPTDLSAEVLKKLKADAEAFLQTEVRQAVITVPAYFHDKPRVATRQAGEQAGLEVLQMIDEPTAAAVAYGFNRADKDETILVYDLGGGTFDISLVMIRGGTIKVIGTDGNHHLGGRDWDNAILTYLGEEFEKRRGFDPLDEPFAFQDLLVRAEDAKKVLSSRNSTAVTVNCRGVMERIEITREVFESRTLELLAQTEILIQQVVNDTGYGFEQISSVLMVGGSTRMPACSELIRRLTGKVPNTSVNPDEAVAVGAAIQGSEYQVSEKSFFLSGSRIHSVTSHSLGMVAVSVDGNRFINSVIIPKNKSIPSSEVRPYQASTREHADNRITVYVTQGEGEEVDNCSFVGKYVISQIPFEKSGKSVLDISYEYDRSGTVRVSAVHKKTRAALTVTEEPLPEDMSWVSQSPRTLVPPHKTIYLAIDLSGSMSGGPLKDAQEAMRGFVQNSDLAHTSVGIIAFADKVQLMVSASQNAKEILRAIDSLRIGLVGGANSAQPFDVTFEQLSDLKGPRFLVALTDGVWSRQEHAVQRAKNCHRAGIEIIAIGFGSADEKFLRQIATSDQSILLSGSGELTAAFENIAQVLIESADQTSLTGLFLKGGR
ncbi:MAG TPA: Hsp70 family protein [Pyrinomonadaceae bacterium]|jgi:molecular chaperone DnaK (HSP70)